MRIGYAVVAIAATAAAMPSFAATSQRTFVATTGVDSAACTVAAPCRSFGAAHSKTSTFGEIVVLDSGGYGPVTITKSVSIIAPQGVFAGVSVLSGDGITVDFPGAIVTLRGLSINGQGGNIGINVKNATRVHVEGCVISFMASNGILDTAPSAELSVVDTIVRNNGGTGIGIAADSSVTIDHVRSEHNSFDGFYIVPGAAHARASITDSLFAWNGANGINVDCVSVAEVFVAVERSTMRENGGSGVTAHGGQGQVTIARSVFVQNTDAQIFAGGPGVMEVMITENTFTLSLATGIRADSLGAAVYANANTFSQNGGLQFVSTNGGGFVSFGNNIGPFWGSSGTIIPGGPYSH
jgi:hypothetical protein